MKKLYSLVDNNKIKITDLNQVKASYLGHLNYGNSKKLIYKTIKNTKCDIDLGKSISIDSI